MSHPVIVPVILSGGSGTRLWPMSRSSRPKQFVKIDSKNSFFQQALLRVQRECTQAAGLTHAPPVVVGNMNHKDIIQAHAVEVGVEIGVFIAEPMRRDSAPAIALAALYVQNNFDNAQIMVLTSDHVIENPEVLWKSVGKATSAAKDGYHITFGITPTRPETGFGYIESGEELSNAKGVFAAKRFCEKPDAHTAAAFLADGGVHWNSGMFLFDVQSLVRVTMSIERRFVTT